ncbi:MAG TPA: MerR family transcriptional regulator [Desulfitobacteriaceae bacterium]|nr:MerR family transcriptional regulator [Desulfitobacteriaceae bacterium]
MYRIGELAEAVKLSKRTVDYYTQLGLLTPSRTETNYRYYSEESLERLKLINLYKNEKLTLGEIRERFQILDEQRVSIADLAQIMHEIREQLHSLQDNLLELKPLLSKLNEKQKKVLTKQMFIQYTSLFSTLSILLGENQLY